MMNPVLASLKRLWDLWDVRILVLLSFTLQVILIMFGNRRKYIASLWISIVVWSAYIMADWVATVALGKLSHVEVDLESNNANPNNALHAIWAPLLLLHLGGPDTITGYSLEDNQLWMRHFIGLVVETLVAIYVILMSWRNSRFSSLSLLALVAGIIKYVERTWLLKLVSGDKWRDIVPFGKSFSYRDSSTRNGDEKFVGALRMAICSVTRMKACLVRYGAHTISLPAWKLDDIDFLNAIEIEMGLFYDLFYTKTPIIYTMRGCILRCISFSFTVFVCVGFFWHIFKEEKRHDHYSMIDIAITSVLLVGALALEIYAVLLLISSDWAMIWLIKDMRDNWVTQLCTKLPWFFPKLGKKKWSRVMGQFNLHGFCIKEHEMTAKFSKQLGLLGIQDKFNMYVHKTRVGVPENLYRIILDHFYYLSDPNHALDEDLNSIMGKLRDTYFHELIIVWHITTEIYYRDHALNLDSNNNFENENKETCRTLSHYLMYLLVTRPSLLPVDIWWLGSIDFVKSIKLSLQNWKDVSEACKQYEKFVDIADQYELSSRFDELLRMARDIDKYLKEMGNVGRAWELLKSMWLTILCYAASKGQKNPHLQQLRQGGDLLTLLWFFLPQCESLPSINIEVIGNNLINELRGVKLQVFRHF